MPGLAAHRRNFPGNYYDRVPGYRSLNCRVRGSRGDRSYLQRVWHAAAALLGCITLTFKREQKAGTKTEREIVGDGTCLFVRQYRNYLKDSEKRCLKVFFLFKVLFKKIKLISDILMDIF